MKRSIIIQVECPYAIACDSDTILCWCTQQIQIKANSPQIYKCAAVPLDPASATPTPQATSPDAESQEKTDE